MTMPIISLSTICSECKSLCVHVHECVLWFLKTKLGSALKQNTGMDLAGSK